MRTKYNEELALLNGRLGDMCGLIEEAISKTVTAMQNNDKYVAKEVMKGDEEINRLEQVIQAQCIKLILTEQPVATDLRVVSSALKMITDLERIGDQSADICRLVISNAGKPLSLDYGHIGEMANVTIGMVNDAVTAFANKNLELAESVIECDDVVDRKFEQARADVVKLIVNDTNNSDEALDMFMTAKYFERIGDHATNIAEWAIFAITGRYSLNKD